MLLQQAAPAQVARCQLLIDVHEQALPDQEKGRGKVSGGPFAFHCAALTPIVTYAQRPDHAR